MPTPEGIDFWTYFMMQGPWAVLFVLLLGWVLKQNKDNQDKIMKQATERENRLLGVLEDLSKNYENLSRDVESIKEQIKSKQGGS